MKYAAADSSYEEADYVLFGVPLEATTSFRKGTGSAPARIREASYGTESYHPPTGVDVADVGLHDRGDVDVWNDAGDTVDYVEGLVSDVVADDGTPILLGGEHTVSVAGARATDADGFVVFDAHLDLKEAFEGSRYSHACVARRLHEDDVEVVVVGGRAGSAEEYSFAESEDVTVLEPGGFRAEDVGEAVEGMERPYVSVDLDVLEAGYVPDVGTPEPFGLTPTEVRDSVRRAAPEAVGFDVVEARPSAVDASVTYAAAFVDEFLAWSEA